MNPENTKIQDPYSRIRDGLYANFDELDELFRQMQNQYYEKAVHEQYRTEPITRLSFATNNFFNRHGRRIGDPKQAQVLDLGCGFGNDAVYLAREGYQVSGVDISDTAISVAKARAKKVGVNIDFKRASARNLPFEDGKFSAIIANASLHGHKFEYLKEAFLEITRKLKPGGLFYFNGMYRKTPFIVDQTEKQGLVRLFDEQTVGRLIQGTGLKIESVDMDTHFGEKNNSERSQVVLSKE